MQFWSLNTFGDLVRIYRVDAALPRTAHPQRPPSQSAAIRSSGRSSISGSGSTSRSPPVGSARSIARPTCSVGAEVALKVLHPRLARDPMVVARFRREGKTLANLRDPHTITAYEVGETCRRHALHRDGALARRDLYERLRAGRRACRGAASSHIARGVCSSLAEAHALGVVHRDLKPENIHVETRGDGPDVVKVLDFGIVKIEGGSSIDDGNELTHAGHMIGTYDYMSPEQIVGSPCRRPVGHLLARRRDLRDAHRPPRRSPQVTGPASMMAALLTHDAGSRRRARGDPARARADRDALPRARAADRFADIRELADALDRVLAPPLHDDVTAVHPAYDPTRDDPGHDRLGCAPRLARIPARRSSRRIAPGSTSKASPWDRRHRDALAATAVARPAFRIATGTGPVRRAPPATLYTTLPGIAVATRPRTAYDVPPAQPELPPAFPIAPLGWPSMPRRGPGSRCRRSRASSWRAAPVRSSRHDRTACSGSRSWSSASPRSLWPQRARLRSGARPRSRRRRAGCPEARRARPRSTACRAACPRSSPAAPRRAAATAGQSEGCWCRARC